MTHINTLVSRFSEARNELFNLWNISSAPIYHQTSLCSLVETQPRTLNLWLLRTSQMAADSYYFRSKRSLELKSTVIHKCVNIEGQNCNAFLLSHANACVPTQISTQKFQTQAFHFPPRASAWHTFEHSHVLTIDQLLKHFERSKGTPKKN